MALTILITHQDGYVSRFGADEPDTAWIPFGTHWESAWPGGWKGGGFNLRRRIDQDVPIRLLDKVEIKDEHGQVMYQGRVVQLPREHGEDFLLGVECMGWASHLLDDPSVPYNFVNRDMSAWQPPSPARVIAAGAVPWTDYVASVANGIISFAGPADIAGGRTVLVNSKAELAFKAPVGTKIQKVMYRGTEANTGSLEAATLFSDDNDAMSSVASNALTLDDTLRTATITTPERYLMMRAAATAQHTPTAPLTRRFSKLGVYANHGLPSAPIPSEPDGFYIDDMLAWALARGAPMLNFTTGVDGTIQRPPVVVPHACDDGLGTVERIVLDLNKYVLYDWLVYDGPKGPTFYYQAADPDRLTWEARLDQGVLLRLEGDDAERAVNGVMVTYNTFDGVTRFGGPVGSGLDFESSLLQDTDPEGTVNAQGYNRKWIDYPVQFTLANDPIASVIGAAYLTQIQLPQRSGDFELPATIGHPTEGVRPSREVRAGDWIRLSDHPADEPRRVISARHTEDPQPATSVSVGNDVNRVDAILEQVQLASRLVVG